MGMIIIRVPAQSICPSSDSGWLKVLLEVTDVDARPHDGIPNLGILRSTLNVSRTILRSTITVSSYAGGLKITPFPWIITFTVTLPIEKIITLKNARAWVSMDFK